MAAQPLAKQKAPVPRSGYKRGLRGKVSQYSVRKARAGSVPSPVATPEEPERKRRFRNFLFRSRESSHVERRRRRKEKEKII